MVWPGEELALIGVLVFVVALALALVAVLRRQRARQAPGVALRGMEG